MLVHLSHYLMSSDEPLATRPVVIEQYLSGGVGQIDLFAGECPRTKHQRTDLSVVRIESDIDLTRRLEHASRFPSDVAIVSHDGAVLNELRELPFYSVGAASTDDKNKTTGVTATCNC